MDNTPSTVYTKTPQETHALGRKIVSFLKKNQSNSATVICLSGELGSGKTTLVSGIACELGITTRILSPTFLLTRQYHISHNQIFYHIDLYRFEESSNSFEIELNDWLSNNNAWFAIEWPERLSLFPRNCIKIYCNALSSGEHAFSIPFIINVE